MLDVFIVWSLQTLLCAVVCVALLGALRRLRVFDERVAAITALGLIGRLVAGQVLFWISYLRLPIGSKLQLGGGLWFFGVDARIFFPLASAASEDGIRGVMGLHSAASGFFLQILAIFIYWFGDVMSVAILLNAICYVVACALLALMARAQAPSQAVPPAGIAAIAAVSFLPSIVIWSLQPLKDTFFLLLVLSAFAACYALQRTSAATGSRPRAVLVFATTWAILWAISSVRWYFGVVFFISVAVYILVLAFTADALPRALFIAIGYILLLSFAVLTGGEGLPPTVRSMLSPWDVEAREKSGSVLTELETTRTTFQDLGGRSIIRAGRAVAGWGTNDASVKGPHDPRWGAPETLSPAARFLTGAVAMALPRVVGEKLGIIRIDGRDEFWLIVELDTLVFDALLVVLFVALVTGWRAAIRNPAAWLVALATAGIAIGLAYAGTNFGTLFRHRAMVHAGLVTLVVILGAHLGDEATMTRWRARFSRQTR